MSSSLYPRKSRKLTASSSTTFTTSVKPHKSQRPVQRSTARVTREPAFLNTVPLEVAVSKVLSTIPPPPVSQMEDVYIAVMGRSGAGKTSFINLASNSSLLVGEGLQSCTDKVGLSQPFCLDGHRIRLVDTPGFDDSFKSDVDVLSQIADFFVSEFKQGRKFHGIIYFHRISDVRMGAISKRNLSMFEKLCGEHAYPNVVLVTSRWDEVNSLVGQNRESELKSKDVFFKRIMDGGAALKRYERTVKSAHDIIRQLLVRNPVSLLIQQEMVEQGKVLQDTEAAIELRRETLAEMSKYEDSMKGLVQELEELKKSNDVDGQKELEDDVEELREKVRNLREENQKLASGKGSREATLEAQTLPNSRQDNVPFEAKSNVQVLEQLAEERVVVGVVKERECDSAELSWSEWFFTAVCPCTPEQMFLIFNFPMNLLKTNRA